MLELVFNKNVIVYEENEEIILVNMIKNNIYSLDFVGSLIWRKINELGDVLEVIDYISVAFNEEKVDVTKDVLEFIQELKNKGVVRINENI